MLARVARARRRRSAAAGVAATAVGILALAIIVPLQSGPGTGVSAPPRVLHTAELLNVIFTDRDNGYALQQRCTMLHPDDLVPPAPRETPDVQRRCRSALLATGDAGRTWKERSLPAEPATKDAGVPILIGHSMLFWVPGNGALALGSWNRRYWTTADGALTWREPERQRELGPPGSHAVLGLDDRPVFLASAPDYVGPKNSIVAASDGTYWVACQTGGCVQSTRDLGRTWQTREIDGAAAVDWVATSNGRTIFAAARGSTIHRSEDGGLTWQAIPGEALAGTSADVLALPNGDLIMTRATETGGMFRLRTGTGDLEPLGGPAHTNALFLTGGWLVAAPAIAEGEGEDLEPVAWISADYGSSWTPIPLPAIQER